MVRQAVLSKVEGLATTLSQVEGQITMTKIQNNQLMIFFQDLDIAIWNSCGPILRSGGAGDLLFPVYSGLCPHRFVPTSGSTNPSIQNQILSVCYEPFIAFQFQVGHLVEPCQHHAAAVIFDAGD